MLILRCTIKAFKKIGGTPRSVEVDMAKPTFGEWCVNTVDFINDGDLLLACMHVKSLYVLFVPVQPPVSVDQLITGLQSRLLSKLIELETPPDAAHRILVPYQDAAILAKTNDRKVVGHMNSALKDMQSLLGHPHRRRCDELVKVGLATWGPTMKKRGKTGPAFTLIRPQELPEGADLFGWLDRCRTVGELIHHTYAAAKGSGLEERDPVILEMLRALEVSTVGDDRTCPYCQRMEGKKYLPGQGPRPPFHLGCRCDMLEIWNDDYE